MKEAKKTQRSKNPAQRADGACVWRNIEGAERVHVELMALSSSCTQCSRPRRLIDERF